MNTLSQQQSREQVALKEAGRTDVRPGAALALLVAFLLVCFSVPLWQAGAEWRDARVRGVPYRPRTFDLLLGAPDLAAPFRVRGWRLPAIIEANRLLLRHMHAWEDRLEDESRLGRWIRPVLQSMLSGRPGVGNEQAYIGRDGWLFYRPDMDYLTGPGFLDPRRLARRAASGPEWERPLQPDPRPAILDFKRQLEARGIRLVLMPAPVKPSVHPGQYAARLDATDRPLQNSSYAAFIGEMERSGVTILDPAPLLARRKGATGEPQYLATDTHWRPEAMEAVARELADMVGGMLGDRPGAADTLVLERRDLDLSSRGDTALLLDLPENQTLFPPEPVVLRQVLDAEGRHWRSSAEADVLVLGDSFSNIYSLEALGWGESAGFVEQFAFHLGRPVDRLVRNDGGAFAARDMLRREMARGRDRLAGKRVVVWQFAARELASGDWRMLALELRDPPQTAFVVPPRGETMTVSGVVREVSPAPRPGTVTYRDHIVTVHLADILDHGEAVVYMRSMTDNVWTRAARLRGGDEITVVLRPWADVAGQYDGINRSELDGMELQLQEPCWGEWPE